MPFYITKYNKRIKKSYEIEVVTPLFISGANIEKSELRASSIKGLLRFWWRAINPNDNLQDLKKKEAEIFGSSIDGISSKSQFSIFIDIKNVTPNFQMPKGKMIDVQTSNKRSFQIDILTYLGIGIYDPRTRSWSRKAISPGSSFIIHCVYNSDGVQQEVEKALSALIYYGGLGAKSRNGFGSLYSKDVPCVDFLNEFKNKKKVRYTSFSSDSKIFEFNEHAKWEDALSEIGIAYRKMRLSTEMDRKHSYINRQYIGLPIVQAIGNDKLERGRHAKPCFMHVSKINDKYKGQILVLPYNYTGPVDNKINQYDNTIKTVKCIFEKLQKGENIPTIY